MKRPKVMAAKVIVSGDVVELYEYEDGVLYDFEKRNQSRGLGEPDEWDGKDEKNLRRARETLRRIVWANMGAHSKFLTLTYAENMQDYSRFLKDWERFLMNLKRHGIVLRYLYVLEYQKRGALHAHVVVFNDEVIPLEALRNAWGRGFLKVNQIKYVKNLGAYVCKYLTKESCRAFDGNRKNDLAAYGSHAYHCSWGLKRPEETKIDLERVEAVEAYKGSFQTTYTCTYSIPVFDSEGNKIAEKRVFYTQGKK